MSLGKGSVVTVNTRPACEGEFGCHGIKPYMDGLRGFVTEVNEREDRHDYGVYFSGLDRGEAVRPRYGDAVLWFREDELEEMR